VGGDGGPASRRTPGQLLVAGAGSDAPDALDLVRERWWAAASTPTSATASTRRGATYHHPHPASLR
jgi:hypothetical protein